MTKATGSNRPRTGSKAEKSYEVGYGRPPKSSQFKPGQSGNAKGRPIGRAPVDDFETVMNEFVIITIGGRPKKMTLREAIYRAVAQQAIRGNSAAARILTAQDQKRSERKKDLMDEELQLTFVVEKAGILGEE